MTTLLFAMQAKLHVHHNSLFIESEQAKTVYRMLFSVFIKITTFIPNQTTACENPHTLKNKTLFY